MSIKAIVLDIEGTTSSTGYVHETLYPYSRSRFKDWISDRLDQPEIQAQMDAVREVAAEPDADLDRVIWWLHHWTDTDQKITPLKTFQGWIWGEGFQAGELSSHFFEDAIPAIRDWHESGRTLFIFSSGSIAAQKAWFGGSPDGDLLPLFTDHFDTTRPGPKRVEESYRAITKEIDFEPDSILFLSDLQDELDAARMAGWHTIGVRRVGDQYYEAGVGDHRAVHSFDEVDLDADYG